MLSRTVRVLVQILIPVGLIFAWEHAASGADRFSFVFGSPSGVLAHFQRLIGTGVFWEHVSATLGAALIGLGIGASLGSVTGIALSLSRWVFQLAQPYIIFVGSLPVFALGPVMIFWFGTGLASKIALVTIATYAVAVLQAYEGAGNADRKLLMMAQSFGASRWTLAKTVLIPSSLVWVLAGVRINIGMALIGAVIGEFIASQRGLGHLIVLGEGLYDMNLIWTGVLSVSLLAIALNLMLAPVERYGRRLRG